MKQEELEAKAREREANMTPEEKLAEKLRLQKVQEESDLRAAMDTFGVVSDKTGIDGMQPTNKTELTELSEAISKKVSQFKHLEDFPGFLEELVRSVCVNCELFFCFLFVSNCLFLTIYNRLTYFLIPVNSNDLQKIKKTVDNLYVEKQKMDKEKNKKSGKGKTKVTLRIESENVSLLKWPSLELLTESNFAKNIFFFI